MWNSYWSGRSRRELPQVNYNESSDEDNFDSPLVSPARPPPTRAGSPVELAVPTLSDNVDEELAAVRQTLENVGHTHTYRGTRPVTRPDPEGVEQEAQEPSPADLVEEVLEVHVVGSAVNQKVQAGNEANMPDIDFEDENGQDGDKALDYTRSLKLEWNPTQVQFWFTQLENEMFTCTVKSQWLKRCVLVKNLPPAVQSDVMSLLVLKKSEAPEDVYKQIKIEILRLHAPKKEETFKKALSRVLTGLPSQLGEMLINDICDKPARLNGCCCSKAVLTLWVLQLPLTVRSHIANMEFTAATYKEVFKAADKVFMSTKATELSASVAAITTTPNDSAPEVAAFKPRKNQNRGTRRGSGSGGGGGSGNNSNASSNKPQKPNTAPSTCCSNHKKWADQAWYCLAPLTCPWKNKCVARPDKEEKK